MHKNPYDDYSIDDDMITAVSACGIRTAYDWDGKRHYPKQPEKISEMKFSELVKLNGLFDDISFSKVAEIKEFRDNTYKNEMTRRLVGNHPLAGRYYLLKVNHSHKYIFKVSNVFSFWDSYDHHWLMTLKDGDEYNIKQNYIVDYDIKYLLEINGYFINDGRIVDFSTNTRKDYQFDTMSLFGASDENIMYVPCTLANMLSHTEIQPDTDAETDITQITEEDFGNIRKTLQFIRA